MSILLDFYETDYGEDFEAMCDWPEEWPHECDDPQGFDDIWFKAYDTSLCESPVHVDLFKYGYLFDCYVWVRSTQPLYWEEELAHFPARTREEAERLLQAAADALYEEEA